MRDGLGVLLVAVGLSWTLLLRDKLGLVIAFAGVTLLAYEVLRRVPPVLIPERNHRSTNPRAKPLTAFWARSDGRHWIGRSANCVAHQRLLIPEGLAIDETSFSTARPFADSG
jgi:hypothetical protein